MNNNRSLHVDEQVPPPVKSRKRARKIITSFHKLTKEVEEVACGSASDKRTKLQRLQRQLEEMGGRQAYQSASLLSVSFHNTSKWVTQQLTKMGLRPERGRTPLKVLEASKLQDSISHSSILEREGNRERENNREAIQMFSR